MKPVGTGTRIVIGVGLLGAVGIGIAASGGRDGGTSEAHAEALEATSKPTAEPGGKPNGTATPGEVRETRSPANVNAAPNAAHPVSGSPGRRETATGIGRHAAALIKMYDTDGDGALTFRPLGEAREGNEALRPFSGAPPAENLSIYPMLVVADWADGMADNEVRQGDLASMMKHFDQRGASGSSAPNDALEGAERDAFEGVFAEQPVELAATALLAGTPQRPGPGTTPSER